MTTRISRRAIACALLATTSLTLPTIAYAETPAPSFVDTIDDHGVDLVTGLPFLQIEEGGIGSGPGAVRMQRTWAEGAGFVDNWTGGLYSVTTNNVTKMYVQFAGISDTFSGSGTTWTSDKAEGSTLTVDPVSFIWTYTARDGTKILFSEAGDKAWNCPGANPSSCQVPLSITRPDGLKFTLQWFETENHIGLTIRRLLSVSSSAGYSVSFTYVGNIVGSVDWFKRASATFDNSANHPSPLPAITYGYPNSTTINVTDTANRMWVFTLDTAGRLTGVKRPGSASNNITYSYTRASVSSSTKDGVTNTYSNDGAGDVTATNPLSQLTDVFSDTAKGRPLYVTDPLSHATSFQYDANARLTRITAQEVNYVQYDYDSRGNVVTQTLVPKVGSGLSNITTSASFDATCTNVVKCNKPNSTTDAKGHITDYAYDSGHGGVTSITQPDPGNGVRPQARYSYTSVAGAGGQSVFMLTKVAACQTLAATSCPSPNVADETQAVTAYNSNLLPTTATRQSGDGLLVSTTAMTYDARGRLDTVDGPLSGTADTTKYRYDTADQLVGVTSPDPDGAGALKNRAIKLTYRSDGQISKQEVGTVNSQSDADWAVFAPLQTVDVTFDTNNRPVTSKLSAGGTDYALTQTSYDPLGRVDCTAVRMNTGVYGSLPASACTLSTQGSDGPDRISQLVYDAAGEVTQLKAGVGTSDAATEETLTYTNNGLVQTLLDAENNKTTYVYDGFDRLAKTRFPLLTKGSGTSSTTDYEQLLNYDANSNVGQRRLRDGTLIAFTYDNLDRVTLKDLPGTEPDVSYVYDNLGRLTQANQSLNNLAFGYDALSRKISEGGPNGSTGFGYDAASERTSVTYSTSGGGSALTVNYAYLLTGELSSIKQGTNTLSSYAYDALGNRTSATFGNGVVQAFTYDAVSRLSSLTNDLSGTANDLTVNSVTYNAASQLKGLTRSNDAYAFTPLASGTTNTVANGLNQQATIDGVTVGWDSKGNLTNDPTTAKFYCYSSENLLTGTGTGANCSPSTATLGYDPALRVYQVAGATTTRFGYDGVDAIAEYNSSNALQRRFVYDDAGQPVVQYEGIGTASPRYLSHDERGSVISLSDSTGAMVGSVPNTYDEYGKPAGTNQGRFQYTGQKWLSEIGAYDYKARVYLPHLGIFAQTDPIGTASGTNIYGYAGGDPVNLADPSGLDEAPPTGTRIDGGISTGLFNFLGYGDNGLMNFIGSTGGYRVCIQRCGEHPPSGFNGPDGSIWIYAPAKYAWISPSSTFGLSSSTGGSDEARDSRTCRAHPILGAIGKINGAINTAIGLGAAAGSAAIGKAMGYSPQIGLGNNAVQVTGAWTVGGRAYTIGNVQVYSAGKGPERVEPSYTGAIVNVGTHEEGHTVQSQILGALYLPLEAVGSLLGNRNPLEVGADRYASGESCTGF